MTKNPPQCGGFGTVVPSGYLAEIRNPPFAETVAEAFITPVDVPTLIPAAIVDAAEVMSADENWILTHDAVNVPVEVTTASISSCPYDSNLYGAYQIFLI